MKARDAIVTDSSREVVVSPWNDRDLEKMLDQADVVEINDDDYRSVYFPCTPLKEIWH